MMWKLDFRRDTLLWALGITFAVGLGLNAVEWVRGRGVEYPRVVVEQDAQMAALRARADSLIALREAALHAPLDINQATAEQLETLDGIGPVLAARIVAHREEHGLFRTVEELTAVSGIGPKRLAALRPRCYVDSL